jgi:hypothetical protein
MVAVPLICKALLSRCLEPHLTHLVNTALVNLCRLSPALSMAMPCMGQTWKGSRPFRLSRRVQRRVTQPAHPHLRDPLRLQVCSVNDQCLATVHIRLAHPWFRTDVSSRILPPRSITLLSPLTPRAPLAKHPRERVWIGR